MADKEKQGAPLVPEEFIRRYVKITASKATTTQRFRLMTSEAELRESLWWVYKANVSRCGYVASKDAPTMRAIESAARWLTAKEAKPGLLLFGEPGGGKTTMADTIMETLNTYISVYASDNPNINSPAGIAYMQKRSAKLICDTFTSDRTLFDRWMRMPMLYIDDVGCEPSEVRFFGNVASPLTDLLYFRYENRLMTIITTNLTIEDIGNNYGPRIKDRMIEMFNRLGYKNKSYRK